MCGFTAQKTTTTHCRCTHEGPPCVPAQDCQRESNAAHRAGTRVSWTGDDLGAPHCAGACAFCVLLCSFETTPMKTQCNQTSCSYILKTKYIYFNSTLLKIMKDFFVLTCITLLLRPVMSASFCSVWASGLLSWANWACMICVVRQNISMKSNTAESDYYRDQCCTIMEKAANYCIGNTFV